MKNIYVLLVVISLSVLAGCEKDTATAAYADHVFINAKAFTLDDAQPWAEAVAVRGDTIIYVGDAEGAATLTSASTEVHDLGGQLLLPGFIDSHAHPVYGGAYATALSLDTFASVDDWVAAIDAYAQANADAPVVFGYGFLASRFGPEGPTRQLIDAIEADRPVLIMDEGFHGAWANTATLKRLGISQDSPDPKPGFSYYKRDANGDATGYLLEGTAVKAMSDLDVITSDIILEGTAIILRIMNSYGVTSTFDAGVADVLGDGEDLNSILRRLEEAGQLTVRIVGSSRPRGPDDVDSAVNTAAEWRETIRGDNYHYRMLKIRDDGTVEGRTAAMFEDYQGEPGNSGQTVYTEEEMTRMVAGAAEREIDVHIHALGERAIHESLNAIEASRKLHPDSATRYTICHLEVITDQDLERFAELDVIAQSTPLWASYDTFGKQFVSDDQFNRFWRFKSLKDLGVRLTFGSDFPSSGAGTLGLSPVVQIEIGHTRQEAGQSDALVQPLASERLDVESLVRGFTIDAAYQLHMEDDIGSLAVGKKADLAVLDQNIFEIDPYEIHKTGVIITMMDGEIVYRAGQ
jgi:hypothetical protein